MTEIGILFILAAFILAVYRFSAPWSTVVINDTPAPPMPSGITTMADEVLQLIDSTSLRVDLFQRIATELDRAYAKHGREPWGRHEFYGIIKEEFDELWEDIKTDAPQEKFLKELVQVAAMCFRYYETGDRYELLRGSAVAKAA